VNLDVVSVDSIAFARASPGPGSEHAFGAGAAAKTLHQQRAMTELKSSSYGIYPNASPSGHGGRRTVKNSLRNQALLGQGGKSGKHCIVSINMLRSTLHLFILSALFVSSIVVHQDFEWTILQSAWHPARDEIIAPCWYTPQPERSVSYPLVYCLVLQQRPTFQRIPSAFLSL
jgi:hypothetical protein